MPYRLPELLALAHKLVFVPEGEKDCDNLAALGLLATTNPGGAGNWKSLDGRTVSATLKGRRVVILPDNDEAGERHAEDVAERLEGGGRLCTDLAASRIPSRGT